MTTKLRALCLLWLSIALLCLVIPIKGQDNANHVYARNALAREIASLKAEYGDAVDASLEGYDHELVAPTLKEARRKRSTAPVQAELAKEADEVKAQYVGDTQRIDLSLDGYDLVDLEDYEEDGDDAEESEAPSTKRKRSFPTTQASRAQEASSVKAEFNNQVDLSLDGYDLNALADDEDDDQDADNADDENLEARDTGSADTDDILGHIYSRSTPLKNYEPVPDKAEFGDDVDLSVDGYEFDGGEDEDDDVAASRLTRRGDDGEDDDDENEGEPAEDLSIPAPDKASFPPGVDFSLDGYDSEELLRRDLDNEKDDDDADDDQYLTSWDDEVRKRDFPDDTDDDTDNDRYYDATEGGEDGTVATADATRGESSKDEAESWYVGVKRWLRGPEQ